MVLRGKRSKQMRQSLWGSSSKRTRCLPLARALLLLLVVVVMVVVGCWLQGTLMYLLLLLLLLLSVSLWLVLLSCTWLRSAFRTAMAREGEERGVQSELPWSPKSDVITRKRT